MKRIFIPIIALIILCNGNLKAQDKNQGGFGIKGGVTVSTVALKNESASDQKNKFRFGGTAGFGYEIRAKKFFAFEIEAMYDLRGTKEEFRLFGNSVVRKNYLHYISIPANLKFYFGHNFNIHFGGYIAPLIAGKVKFVARNNSNDIVVENSYSITGDEAKDPEGDEFLKRFDAGLQFGLEFVSNKGMGVGARFSKGLLDVTNDQHFSGNGYSTTTEISLYIIYRFKRNG